MQVVIEVSEEQYNALCMKGVVVLESQLPSFLKALRNGTPLPKGHGRLIDEKKITKFEQVGLIITDDKVTRCLVTDAPTVIEADRKRRTNNADCD